MRNAQTFLKQAILDIQITIKAQTLANSSDILGCRQMKMRILLNLLHICNF